MLLLPATASSASAPVTSATFVSETGDYIGGGLDYTLPTVTVDSQSQGEVTFDVSNASGDSFTMDFAAPAGDRLAAGTYDDTEAAAVRTAGLPGLDVWGDGRGCDEYEGSFTVYDATYNGSGVLQSFAAQFFQHCEGFYPALMGNILWNSSATVPPVPATAPEPPQSAQLVSLPGDFLGQGQASSYSIAFPFGETPNREGPNRWELSNGNGSSIAWDINIAAAGNAALAVGTYNGAQRFGSFDVPTLDVSGEGRGCNESTGSFTIYDLTYDAFGMLSSFAMEFNVTCQGDTAPLYGAILWNSSVAMPALPNPIAGIQLSETSANFGSVRVGDVATGVLVTVYNDGGATDDITGGTISGADPDDFFGESNCSELAPEASCVIELAFLPGAAGERMGDLVLVDSANSGSSISLSGSGTEGYYEVSATGQVFPYGDATSYGDASHTSLGAPIVSITTVPGGFGYWLLGSDGGIFSYGDASFFGSTGGLHLNKPVIAMASTPDGGGYWLVASDGGIFNYGDAPFYGSTGGLHLNQPIVGMASTPDGRGYWLVASDGGIFSYGDASFYGSTGGIHLNRPIVGMTPTPDGRGYWLVASDGGVFGFGDASFFGSTGSLHLAKPIVGMAPSPTGDGYWFVASDGGLFNYGDAPFDGSSANLSTSPIVAMASSAPPTLQAFDDVPALRARALQESKVSRTTWTTG